MYIDDSGVDSVGGQKLGGLQGLGYHQAAGEHSHILTLPEYIGLADLEGVILLEHGGGQAGGAHIGGALKLSQSQGGLAGFLGIGGDNDRHAGNQAHEADILQALVTAAVFTHGYAGVGAADLHIKLGIGDRVADLLIGTACAEHGKGGAEGNKAHGGKASADIHHVALGNTAVEEAVRISGFEMLGHCGAGQVSIQHHNLIIGGTQLYQSLAVCLAGRNFFTHGLSPPIPAKPADAARRWAPCRASPLDSP